MNTDNYRISEDEREFAINHLSKTRDAFVEAIKDVGESLWYKRPGQGEWSIAECADHIMQTELYYFWPTLEKMLAEPADPSRRTETEGKDQISYQYMENRSKKLRGQPWEESSDKVIDKDSLITAFTTKRNEVINWLRNSTDEMRVHYTFFPGLDTLDVYQFILMISGHTIRHTGQIEDIKKLDLTSA